MRLTEISKRPQWQLFMVYGSFNDPETGMNFFIVRIPNKRVPFGKKIRPAINSLVRSFFNKKQIDRHNEKKRFNGYSDDIHWAIDWEGGDYLWTLTQSKPRRLEWDGEKLVEVPYEELTQL